MTMEEKQKQYKLDSKGHSKPWELWVARVPGKEVTDANYHWSNWATCDHRCNPLNPWPNFEYLRKENVLLHGVNVPNDIIRSVDELEAFEGDTVWVEYPASRFLAMEKTKDRCHCGADMYRGMIHKTQEGAIAAVKARYPE